MPRMSTHPSRQPPALAEIPEAQATGAVAVLYDDIRDTLGVDLVNLVYRHLATVPGALAWAWANLGPHFRSGAIDAQAQALRAQVGAATASWRAASTATLGAHSESAAAAALAHAYTVNNSRNLLAFQHLLREGAGGENGSPVHASANPARLPPLPPIPGWQDMHPIDRATVLRLNRLGEAGEPAIVASLYRHLALWPRLLGDVEPVLVQIDARGDIARALALTVQAARAIAQASPLTMPHPPPPAVDAALRLRLRAFVDVTIPKMVPVGLALAAAFGHRP